MKRVLYFGLILTATAAMYSCETPKEVVEERPVEGIAEPIDVPFRKMKDGYLTGNGEEGIVEGGMVIKSQAQWDVLVSKMNSVNDAIEQESIDFKTMTVVAYFDQVRGSGGYGVDFTSLQNDGNKINILVGKKAPTEDAIEIMTQPFVVGLIDKTDKTIMFID